MEQIAWAFASMSTSQTLSISGLSFDKSTTPGSTRHFWLLIAAPNSSLGHCPSSKAGILKCRNRVSGEATGFTCSRSSSATSENAPSCHPSGISPSSESMSWAGHRSASGLGRPRSRPSALPRTGSKSTNHGLKSACAIASSVSLIRRFISILSSNVPRM